MGLRKHVDEKERFGIDFTNFLDDGENLATPITLKVVLWDSDNDTWVDKSSEFSPFNEGIAGTVVEFDLNAASTGDQSEEHYVIYCKVDTDAGDTNVETADLYISDRAKV